ncbi:MAG TPA: CehA/McbA family metallohydrolase [bacterium]|nr:CehA/McbA family metallohydrolase [bacterium]HQG45348.1 CehA/McbA family metallohydrolase [bacterium]HQI47776.1 CehA/McbA family metallohydrolase [bacterium]HQJ63206.1 CehA/McbA family metallohydrolase [bacterium]
MISPASLDHPLTNTLIAGFLLYVETHYRIGRLPSRYFRRRAEILFDLPHRIAPGRTLPLLLMIKDADRYPVELLEIQTAITMGAKTLVNETIALGGEKVHQPLWWRTFPLTLPAVHGALQVTPLLICRQGGRLHRVQVDNYPTLRHAPLKVWHDDGDLPGIGRWCFGDLHYHSHLTSDQVEFGAPPEAAAAAATAMGLEFFAVTDHSYDLDDGWDDYLHADATLGKWHWLLEFTREWNEAGQLPVILAGEELSAGNCRGRNVHFLLLNEPDFYPGWGDSAEHWLRCRPQWRISEVLERLRETSLAFAGHAASRPPRLQRLFLGRDHWRAPDYEHPRLDGVQMWNSLHDASLERGLAVWRHLLLSGRRAVLVGGNDAHGDWGRWRQIAFPHLTLKEKEEHLFGQVRTGVARPPGRLTPSSLLEALRAGRCLVTSGPAAWLELTAAGGTVMEIGDTCTAPPLRWSIGAESAPAFGPLESVTLCIGDLRQKKETRRSLTKATAGSWVFHMEEAAPALPARGYLRLEVSSRRDATVYRCFTNPLILCRD